MGAIEVDRDTDERNRDTITNDIRDGLLEPTRGVYEPKGGSRT